MDRFLNVVKLNTYLSSARIPRHEFAKRISMPMMVLETFLNGVDPIPYKVAEKFAEGLGCAAEDILLPMGSKIEVFKHADGSLTKKFG